jgi:endogenous inhibitor of DNA gyrase (YacG/DUF329 family)
MVLRFIAFAEDAVESSAEAPEPYYLSQTQDVFGKHIFVNCPGTGKPVSTGLSTDKVVFESLPAVAVPLRCPACGKTHEWKPSEAWVGRRQR